MRVSCILLLMIACACCPARMMTESSRDSVVVVVRDSVIVRDSVVYAEIPAESGANRLQIRDTSVLETSVAKSEAFVNERGELCHTLTNKAEMLLPVRVQLVDRARLEKSTTVGWRNIVETVEVEKELSRWQNFIMTLGYSFLIAVVGWLMWKLSKFFI